MKQVYPINPCPWCKKTPKFEMEMTSATWLPKLSCRTEDCHVQPASKYVPIRKSQKFTLEKLKPKLEKMINSWNKGNPLNAFEGIVLDFEVLAEKGRMSESELRDTFKRFGKIDGTQQERLQQEETHPR